MSDVLTLAEPIEELQKPSRDYALRKKSLTASLAEAERIIQSALSHPKLIEPLARVGFDGDELRRGLALLAVVREKHAARREAMVAATQGTRTRDSALDAAIRDFCAYRQAVQICYRGAERTSLGIGTMIPDGSEQFCDHALKAYTMAKSQSFAAALGKHGFGPERLKSALKTLDVLADADRSLQMAQTGAQAATETRDAAKQTLEEWMTRLQLLARVALRRSPTQVRQLIE